MTAEIFGSTSFNAAGEFRGVAFSPDGSELLAVTRGTKRSWVRRFAVPGGALLGERELAGDWSELAVLPDGAWILWSGADAICITSGGKTKWKHASARGGGWLAVSPDRTQLSVCANRKCTVLGASDGKRRFEVESNDELFTSAISPDGQFLATGSQKGELHLFDGKGRELAKKQTTKVLTLRFAADSKTLLSGHGSGEVALWEVPALARHSKFRGAQHEFEQGGASGCRWMAFLPGGRAITLGNEHLLRVWSLATGKELSRIEIPPRHYQGAPTALSPDGRLLAMGGTEGALSVWKLEGARPFVRDAAPTNPSALALTSRVVVMAARSGFVAWDRKNGRSTERPAGFPPTQVRALSGDRFVLLDYDRVSIATKLGAPGKPLCQLSRYSSGAAAISSDGALLAVPVGEWVECRDLKTGVERARLPHEASVKGCAFGPGDEWLATVDDRAVHLWSLKGSPAKVHSVALPADVEVRGFAVSPSGRVAVSYRGDGDAASLAFIDPSAGRVTATLKQRGVWLGQVAFVGGARAAVTDSCGRLLLADGALGKWLEFPQASDAAVEPLGREALPVTAVIAKKGTEVAHVDGAGNVVVRSLPPGRDDVHFELAAKPVVAGKAQGLFAERLAGAVVLIGGKFGAKPSRFIKETVVALGGSLAKKSGPKVTHASFFHNQYGARTPSADEQQIDALIKQGAAITKLSPVELNQLLLPTLAEAQAMLRGELKDGIGRWNEWRERYHDEWKFPVELRGIDVAGADLRKAQLKGVHFEEATLTDARLAGADLFDCVFRGAKMAGADLTGASCYRTVFSGVDLSGAKLGADFSAARLDGANLEGADLRKATLSSADLKGARLEGAKLPPGASSR